MQIRTHNTDVTATAFALAAGRVAIADIKDRMFNLKRSDGRPLSRGYQLQIIGSGPDDAQGEFRLWRALIGRIGNSRLDADLSLQAYGTFTLSSAVGLGASLTGSSASVMLTTERYADTLTYTVATNSTSPKGVGDLVVTATGAAAAQVFSPTGNVPGHIIVPDAGDVDAIICELRLTSGGSAWGAGAANALMASLE